VYVLFTRLLGLIAQKALSLFLSLSLFARKSQHLGASRADRRYRRVISSYRGRSIEKASAVNAQVIFRHCWNARDYQQAS